MNYKDKQEWIDAVMASNLTPATKVYAYGIFKHMYGNKDDSFPGAKALRNVTGLNDSQFYRYNQALQHAGFIEVTSRKGTSNEYRLIDLTSREGMYLPSDEVGVPQERVGGTSTEGTNTTKNTTKDTPMEEYNDKQGPVDKSPTPLNEGYEYLGSLNQEDFEGFSNSRETLSFDYLGNSEGVAKFEAANEVTSSEGTPQQHQSDTPSTAGVSDGPVDDDRPSKYRYKGVLYPTVAARMRAEDADRMALMGDDW